jgi:hypothetical protein
MKRISFTDKCIEIRKTMLLNDLVVNNFTFHTKDEAVQLFYRTPYFCR